MKKKNTKYNCDILHRLKGSQGRDKTGEGSCGQGWQDDGCFAEMSIYMH